MSAAARQQLFEGHARMSDDLARHDPTDRALDGEPHFLLLARDPTAAELVRMWVAIRRRDPALIDAIAARLKARVAKLPYRPKDAEHVTAAQQVSNAMDLWLVKQQSAPLGGTDGETGE